MCNLIHLRDLHLRMYESLYYNVAQLDAGHWSSELLPHTSIPVLLTYSIDGNTNV